MSLRPAVYHRMCGCVIYLAWVVLGCGSGLVRIMNHVFEFRAGLNWKSITYRVLLFGSNTIGGVIENINGFKRSYP